MRYLIPISEKTNKPLTEVIDKYISYMKLKDKHEVLEFNKDAYKRTKQFYLNEDVYNKDYMKESKQNNRKGDKKLHINDSL